MEFSHRSTLLFFHDQQGATMIPFALPAALWVTGQLMKFGSSAIVSTTLGFVVAWMKMNLMLVAWNLRPAYRSRCNV